jgi:hypothetical protein
MLGGCLICTAICGSLHNISHDTSYVSFPYAIVGGISYLAKLVLMAGYLVRVEGISESHRQRSWQAVFQKSPQFRQFFGVEPGEQPVRIELQLPKNLPRLRGGHDREQAFR